MAIKDTINWLQSKIPEPIQRDALRKRFGKVRDHKIVYNKNWIEDELLEAFKKAAYMNWHKANPGQQPTKKQVTDLNKLVRSYLSHAYGFSYYPQNVEAKYQQAGVNPRALIISKPGRDVVVEFATNTGEDFEGFVSWGKRNKVNVASIELLKEAAGELVRAVKGDASVKGSSLAKGITQRSNATSGKTGVLSNISGRQGNAWRLHGFPGGDANPDGGVFNSDDTTIALLGFEENLHAVQSGQMESDVDMFLEAQGSQRPVYDEIMKEIHDNWFDQQWTVNNHKFSDIKNFRDKIEIAIMIGHSSKNNLMRYADADGIAEFLDVIADALLKELDEDATDWAERSASKKTPRQRMNESAVEATVDPIVKKLKKNKNLNVTTKGIKKFKKTNETTKGKKTVTKAGSARGGKRVKAKKSSKARIATASKAAAGSMRKSSKGRGSQKDLSMNPIGLQQLLNKALPEELMKNMGPYPRRLENRTGRFAQSAQVTQVVPMPKSVEIRYDYLKDPYAVFEPENGNAMASTGRDPKMLIGGTIRELAQSIMGTKYGLVRTKRV